MEHTLIPTEELEVFKALKNIKVVFDVGARVDIDYLNIFPKATHHLFEPNPEFFKELKEKEKAGSFDKLIIELIMHKEKIPKSMFGALKGKTKPFTREERKKLWRDDQRWQ